MGARPSTHESNELTRMASDLAPTLEQIYDAHFQFVWRVLRRLGVSNQDVRDAVQDVFVVVHRKLPEFRRESKLTTWLFAICLRVASDRRRIAHVRREIPAGANLDAGAGSGDLTADVERRDALTALERILEQMPLEQRAVFTLFELEGERCDDIAELLAIPVGTVYSRLRLARQFFKKCVARQRARESFELGCVGGTS